MRISDWRSDVCTSDRQTLDHHRLIGVVDVKAIAQAIKSNANQAMMIQRQLQQYQNLLLNSTGLPMQEWGETIQAINSVNNVMRQSQSLSFQSSNLQQQLLNKFKGYGTYNSGSISAADMQCKYQQWSDDTRSEEHTSELQSLMRI